MPFLRSTITPKEAYDGNHWRKRSELARLKARNVVGKERARLIKVADEYDRLAKLADDVQSQIKCLDRENPSSKKAPQVGLFDVDE